MANRLAHNSVKRLKFVNDRGVFGKDQISDVQFCNHHILGKHCGISFSFGKHKSSKVLEYIHTGLLGSKSNPTFGGNKYFLSIIDDFSKMCVSLFAER